MSSKKRTSGSVRKLPSGKWQARVRNGKERLSLGTFATKREADNALCKATVQVAENSFIDKKSSPLLSDYMAQEIAVRNLKPSTVAYYNNLAENKICPHLGDKRLVEITPTDIKEWYLKAGEEWSKDAAAKSYRLLSSIMKSAEKERYISHSPCTIKGAGKENARERKTITIPQIIELANRMPDRYKALILTAGLGCLRSGECKGLRRLDVDLKERVLHVRHQLQVMDGKATLVEPKCGSTRAFYMPDTLYDALSYHLDTYTSLEPTSFVFSGERGGRLDTSSYCREWAKAREQVEGIPEGFTFHDLRHSGLTGYGQSGATIRELQEIAGHRDINSVIRYQHTSYGALKAVAKRFDDKVERETRPALRLVG